MSDDEQAAFAKACLDDGMAGERGSALGMLTKNRSSLILPIMEQKVEEVMKAKNPLDHFTDRTVDLPNFFAFAGAAIAEVGDEQALRGIGNLLKLDEERFAPFVALTFASARSKGNPFSLAYRGLDMSMPALEERIAEWVDKALADRTPEWPGGPPSQKRIWAEALAERYRGVPVQEQWQSDPIVSRLSPGLAAILHDDVYRIAREAWDLRTLPARLTETEQVAFVKAVSGQGIPPESFESLLILARARSSVVLPVIERKIEQVVMSSNPAECFTDKTVEPDTFLALATRIIAEAGDQEALMEASKLLKFKKFSNLIGMILHTASNRGNPFPIAYLGIEIGDPEVSKRIITWAEEVLSEPALNIPTDGRHLWAEAMADRYGAVPIPSQWNSDPIASRLKPPLAGLARGEVLRLAAEAMERRQRSVPKK
jgi:hypothetical protein